MIKQVIVMRKDLNMRKGKMVAQGAHASMKVFFNRMYRINDKGYATDFSKEMEEWMESSFTKIVLGVDSEQEILELGEKARENCIPFAIITDNGTTEFNGVKTITCIAIGPEEESKVNEITGNLNLL
jgi:PTH2 family peptidyl-tRNA hydrolase